METSGPATIAQICAATGNTDPPRWFRLAGVVEGLRDALSVVAVDRYGNRTFAIRVRGADDAGPVPDGDPE